MIQVLEFACSSKTLGFDMQQGVVTKEAFIFFIFFPILSSDFSLLVLLIPQTIFFFILSPSSHFIWLFQQQGRLLE
jgi:hypothetical protein